MGFNVFPRFSPARQWRKTIASHHVTAEGIGSCKPDPRNFEYLLTHFEARGIVKGDILHTAHSLHHDHVQATVLDLATNWIDRRHGAEGYSATMPPKADVRIDFHFPSMAAFVEAHQEKMEQGR